MCVLSCIQSGGGNHDGKTYLKVKYLLGGCCQIISALIQLTFACHDSVMTRWSQRIISVWMQLRFSILLVLSLFISLVQGSRRGLTFQT